MNPRDQDPQWYKDAIIYELHVKAFFDSSGDGIGDFPGLIQKLDYLRDLGVTALWLLPFYPSPLRDDGYDIADYRAIHPSYGTMKDFKRFVREAHRRGMAVISELVINHTSDQHPWFQAARRAPRGSARRNYYVWSDSDKRYSGVRIIFVDTEASNWTWDPVAQQYYWHRFFHHQPDLNFDNPVVRRKVIEIMRWWLEMGVDGLRLDAIPYLVERDGTNCENLAETHACIKEIRAAVDAAYAGRMLLAEANQWPTDVRHYFGDSDECHMAFQFPVMPRMYMALRQEDRRPIVDIMQQTPDIPPDCQWAIFLRNHDELTLEMVTDEERDYMYSAYAADPQMRVNVGIRRRLGPLLNNSRRRMELMTSLLLSFPGTPVLYYGDEIGMGDNVFLGDRNGVRTPMQWSSDRNAGFSRADPARLYHPVIMDPIYGYQAINVEAQERDPSSLLNWNRRIIALRKSHKVFGRGRMDFLHPRNRKVLAYTRSDENETVLCVANLSRFVQPVELDLRRFMGLVPVEMIGRTQFPAVGEVPYFLTLAPHGFYWFQLQKAAGPIQVWPPPRVEVDQVLQEAPVLSGGWQEALSRSDVLAPFIQRQRWSGAQARPIESVQVRDWGFLREPDVIVALAEARFRDGGTATYVLPLALGTGVEAAATSPGSVMARVDGGVLYDAMVDEDAARAFLAVFDEKRSVAMQTGTLRPTLTKAWREIRGAVSRRLKVELGGVEQSNSSVRYGRRLFLKLYRKVEPGPNPDVELPEYLSNVAGFRNVPRTAGTLIYEGAAAGVGAGEPPPRGIVLGLMSAQIPSQGDGWEHALDELGRYYETVATERRHEAPPLEKRRLVDLAALPVTELARNTVATYLQAAWTLGQRTAEMHLALGRASADDLKPQPLAQGDLKALSASLKGDVDRTLGALRERLDAIPETSRGAASQVLAGRDALLKRASALGKRRPQGEKIRIHGDYHLGQVLWSGWDYVILDFEGEPARPVPERRLRQSPLRDVAGMVRSFAYASFAGLFDFTVDRPDDRATLLPWARFWYQWTAAAFLAGYRGALGEVGIVPADPAVFDELLSWFILQKAVYELLYELNHRPDWVMIPLQGLLDLLEEPA